MSEPLETLYCREVVARYGDWKDRYVPIPARLIEEQQEGVWPSGNSWPGSPRFTPEYLARCWLTGRVVPRARTFADVTQVAGELPALLLLGESGAGKSSVLCRLALVQALAVLENTPSSRLPLLVPLNRYRPPTHPVRFLVQQMEQQGREGFPAHQQLASVLREHLESGRMLLFLDGLDNLPETLCGWALRRWLAFVRRYGNEGRGNQVIITARQLDPAYPANLPAAFLLPLNEEGKWQLLSICLDEQDRLALWEELRRPERRDLLALAGNPFFLTVLADLFRLGVELSHNRGRLLAAWVSAAIAHAQQELKSKDEQNAIPGDLLRQAFGDMAWSLSRGQGAETAAKASEMRKTLSRLAHAGSPDALLSAGRSLFLDGEELLTTERQAPDPWLWFRHRLLQAYFSAESLGRRLEAGRERVSLWRPPQPRADSLKARRLRHNAFRPLPALVPHPQREEALLLAGLMSDASELVDALAKVNPCLAGECVLEQGVCVSKGIRQVTTGALVEVLSNKQAALRLRIAAGEVLGKLGDPRLSETIPVPAGEIMLGDGRHSHPVAVSAFRLARYPVTQGEFALFVASDAYRQRELWTKSGWEWSQAADALSRWRARGGDKFDAPLQRPNHPVTGVTWYEAVAYGNWLTSTKGVLYRLPTETEWEKAARGTDGRAFPWGDDSNAARANTCTFDEVYVFDTTPVGIYPEGVGPYGGYDQAGNVWEWCSSRYLPYPYDAHDGRESLQGEDARVLRGGSWLLPMERARCSTRGTDLPDVIKPDIGFRVVEIAN